MATKIAIEVDVKTQGAVSEIDELKQQMVKLQATTNELKGKMEGGFKSAEKGAEGASKGMKGFGGSIGGVLKSLGTYRCRYGGVHVPKRPIDEESEGGRCIRYCIQNH
jgi:hypothetical protein